MSTNKYRRRRAMRTPTAGTKYQNEPIQAPLQKVDKTPFFDALGRKMQDASLNRTIQTLDTSTNQQQRQASVSCLMRCRDNKHLSEMLNVKCWEAEA